MRKWSKTPYFNVEINHFFYLISKFIKKTHVIEHIQLALILICLFKKNKIVLLIESIKLMIKCISSHSSHWPFVFMTKMRPKQGKKNSFLNKNKKTCLKWKTLLIQKSMVLDQTCVSLCALNLHYFHIYSKASLPFILWCWDQLFSDSLLNPKARMRNSQRTGVRQYNKSELPRLRWTPELHKHFSQAVERLGGKFSKLIIWRSIVWSICTYL